MKKELTNTLISAILIIGLTVWGCLYFWSDVSKSPAPVAQHVITPDQEVFQGFAKDGVFLKINSLTQTSVVEQPVVIQPNSNELGKTDLGQYD